MLAKMIDKIVSLKETKIFEIGGQTYTDGHLTRIPPHVDRPEAISVSGLDGVCKLIRTELEKVDTTIMVQAKSYKSVEVMTTYLPDFSRNILYRAEADAPGLRTGFRGREVALIELRSLFIPNEGTAYLLDLGDARAAPRCLRKHRPRAVGDRPGHREGCEGRRNCDRDQDGRVHRRRHQGHGRSDPPRS